MVHFVQNFIKLSAAIRELSCSQSLDDAESNTAITTAGSNDCIVICYGSVTVYAVRYYTDWHTVTVI